MFNSLEKFITRHMQLQNDRSIPMYVTVVHLADILKETLFSFLHLLVSSQIFSIKIDRKDINISFQSLTEKEPRDERSLIFRTNLTCGWLARLSNQI